MRRKTCNTSRKSQAPRRKSKTKRAAGAAENLTPPILQWSQGRWQEAGPNPDFKRKVWKARNGRYRVEKIVILLGKTDPYAPYYLAIWCGEGAPAGGYILNEHRKLHRAQETCENHFKGKL